MDEVVQDLRNYIVETIQRLVEIYKSNLAMFGKSEFVDLRSFEAVMS